MNMLINNYDSIRCLVKMGKKIPFPISAEILNALQFIEISNSDTERSGFQITFYASRSGSLRNCDYTLLKNPQLNLLNRVEILINFNSKFIMLMDGIITHTEIDAETGSIVVTGEDIGLVLDKDEKTVAHAMQDDGDIVRKIIADYSQYHLIPKVVKPPITIRTGKGENSSLQFNMTDWAYITWLAKRYAYVFYIENGPSPQINTAYWGPPKYNGSVQPRLLTNSGPYSNTSDVRIYHEPLLAKVFSGMVQDKKTNKFALISKTKSQFKALAYNLQSGQKENPKLKLGNTAGLSCLEANELAQAKTNITSSKVVKVTGQLDVMRYGAILQARNLVELNGVGHRYDGKYYVQQVVHKIHLGNYKQNFTLIRDGIN